MVYAQQPPTDFYTRRISHLVCLLYVTKDHGFQQRLGKVGLIQRVR
jgi:hypothetical protein